MIRHRVHRSHRVRKEDTCGDSLSATSGFSVVKTPYRCRRHAQMFVQSWGCYRNSYESSGLFISRPRSKGHWRAVFS